MTYVYETNNKLKLNICIIPHNDKYDSCLLIQKQDIIKQFT